MFQLGIDVSKKTLDLCLLREGVKGKIKTKKLKNQPSCAITVINWLRQQKCDLTKTHIIMEPTGVYHESLAYGLHHAGVKVSLANPHRAREFARGMDILTKNDSVDAYMLACYGALKEPTPWQPPPENVRHLRSLLHRRDALVADRVREKNRLEKTQATNIPMPIVESIENMIEKLSAEINQLESLIREHIEQHSELKKDFELLTSIKSVGFQLGLNMLVILRSHTFDSAEQAAAFLGMVPVEKSSGTSVKGKVRLSRMGSPAIRSKLYLSAICGLRYNPMMKEIYERLCRRGKARMCAIGALMRKLVHWCYGVLKTQQPFNINYRSSGTHGHRTQLNSPPITECSNLSANNTWEFSIN